MYLCQVVINIRNRKSTVPFQPMEWLLLMMTIQWFHLCMVAGHVTPWIQKINWDDWYIDKLIRTTSCWMKAYRNEVGYVHVIPTALNTFIGPLNRLFHNWHEIIDLCKSMVLALYFPFFMPPVPLLGTFLYLTALFVVEDGFSLIITYLIYRLLQNNNILSYHENSLKV